MQKKKQNKNKAVKTRKALPKTVQKIKLKPTADRVLIKEELADVREKTISGIIIPATAEKDANAKRGTVVAVGPGKYDGGKLLPMSVSIGNIVLFQWGEKVIIDDEEYYIVREAEILGVLK
jgi:chaperonin GroES